MSMDTHLQVQELLPAYALNCLDEEDTILVSEHLAECPVCRAEQRAYQAVADQLALAAPEAIPSPRLERRLLTHLQFSPPIVSGQPRPAWWPSLANLRQRISPIWGLVSLVLILILAIGNLLLWQRLNQPGVTSGPGEMRAIPLSSTGVAPKARGFIIIGADGRNGALVVDQLPPLDAEHQYQLWLIRDGWRTSGAVFSVDQDGYGGTRISAPELLFEYSSFGVTIEPVGGSSGPTGEKVLDGGL